jgi:nucleotide-binding universal stress UspA family protein
VQRIVVAAKPGADQPWLAEAAAQLAKQAGGATVDAVSADGIDMEAFSTVPRSALAEETGDAAEKLAERVRAQGVEAAAHSLQGPVVRSILLFAEERDADLIVVGGSTRGRLAQRLLGTVPVELIRRSRRPVLVITPPAGRS